MGHKFLDKSKFYLCYSPRVHEHLKENGFTTYMDDESGFNGTFLNIKTSKYCHVYSINPELSTCIAEVSNLKK